MSNHFIKHTLFFLQSFLRLFQNSLQKGLTNGKKRGIILPASYAMAARRYMEMYSRGRRGAPAKGVGRVYRRESSNLSISANEKDPTAKAVGSFSLLRCRDLKIAPARRRERERAKRRRWRMQRRRASEQIRSIGSAPRVRDRDDYICEVRRLSSRGRKARYDTLPRPTYHNVVGSFLFAPMSRFEDRAGTPARELRARPLPVADAAQASE